MRTTSGFYASYFISAKDNPVKFCLRHLLDQSKKRCTTTDFNIIRVSS